MKRIIIMSFVIAIFGCAPFPHYEWVRPKVSGKIVDANTSLPISDVKILVVNEDRKIVNESRSNINGKFLINPKKYFYFFSYFGDKVIAETLAFAKQNYKEKSIDYSIFSTAGETPPEYQLGDISLSKIE